MDLWAAVLKLMEFLSTPSGWRATASQSINRIRMQYFYPRPPGGGRLKQKTGKSFKDLIFLSTPSGWRATSKAPEFCIQIIISIHALRVEGDGQGGKRPVLTLLDFYPRPPGGGRLL